MPKTINYRPTIIDDLITNERINSYQCVFHPESDVELMGAYLWNSHVSSAIYPLVGTAEITLRNAIDRALKEHLGKFWWSGNRLHYRSFMPGAPVPRAVQSVRDNFARATQKFAAEQRSRHGVRGRVVPTHHGVVAKTEFSTWEFMLDHEFMGNNLIWPSRLGTVFAGTWPTRQAATMLTYVRDLVSTVREFRNRLFHHEPAWKRFSVSTEADALHHLHEKIDRIESLVRLIHPESLRLLERNGLLRAARRACTAHEIRRFQHLAEVHKIGSMRKLTALVNRCNTNDAIFSAKVHQGRQQRFLLTPV